MIRLLLANDEDDRAQDEYEALEMLSTPPFGDRGFYVIMMPK